MYTSIFLYVYEDIYIQRDIPGSTSIPSFGIWSTDQILVSSEPAE